MASGTPFLFARLTAFAAATRPAWLIGNAYRWVSVSTNPYFIQTLAFPSLISVIRRAIIQHRWPDFGPEETERDGC
jgi:hypothetical protein